jgi:hypothetical protein
MTISLKKVMSSLEEYIDKSHNPIKEAETMCIKANSLDSFIHDYTVIFVSDNRISIHSQIKDITFGKLGDRYYIEYLSISFYESEEAMMTGLSVY